MRNAERKEERFHHKWLKTDYSMTVDMGITQYTNTVKDLFYFYLYVCICVSVKVHACELECLKRPEKGVA